MIHQFLIQKTNTGYTLDNINGKQHGYFKFLVDIRRYLRAQFITDDVTFYSNLVVIETKVRDEYGQ